MKRNARLDLVELCRVWGEAEALVIRSLLEANGIPCHFSSLVDHKVHPFSLDGLAEIRIFVHPDDIEDARILVSDTRG
jgi:hypothetical protein